MRAGLLDRRITIQRPVQTLDDFGGATDAWEDVATVWARVEPVAAREQTPEPQVVAVHAAQVTIRWRTGIDEAMRISFEGRFYQIVSIVELARREGLVMQMQHIGE